MFRFKQFTVSQDLCAMKVGTDGVLLGAWASVPTLPFPRILDVGTGTGLIALMMAQRYPKAHVTAIDIDEGSFRQATVNVEASPFSNIITVLHEPLQNHCIDTSYDSQTASYSAIVCNPPFFISSLKTPNDSRNLARHADSLTYKELMEHSWRLLSDDGEMSIVVPFDYRQRMEDEAIFQGFFLSRRCAVYTAAHNATGDVEKSGKMPKRYLLAFRKHPSPLITTSLVIGSRQYCELTRDYYLDK